MVRSQEVSLPFAPPPPRLPLGQSQLSHLTQAAPAPTGPPPGQQLTHNARRTRPYNTSNGPSQWSLVIMVDASTSVELLPLGPQISAFVDASQSTLLVESFRLAYGGLCLTTTSVPSLSDSPGWRPSYVLSFLTTVFCEILSSRSFCKLMDVPFLRGGKPITPKDAKIILRSTVYKDSICLAAPPRIVCDSRRADTCTVYTASCSCTTTCTATWCQLIAFIDL